MHCGPPTRLSKSDKSEKGYEYETKIGLCAAWKT